MSGFVVRLDALIALRLLAFPLFGGHAPDVGHGRAEDAAGVGVDVGHGGSWFFVICSRAAVENALGSRLLLRFLTAPGGHRARRSSNGWMYGAAAAVLDVAYLRVDGVEAAFALGSAST